MDIKDLPDTYVDCLIQHEDKSMRIGRLHHAKQYFELASYQERRCFVVWPIEKVINCRVIDFNFKESSND